LNLQRENTQLKAKNEELAESLEKSLNSYEAEFKRNDGLRGENDQLKARNEKLREALREAEIVLRMINEGIQVDRKRIGDAGENCIKVLQQ
jgi:methylphosphotriester-DNA--protein-cysteine methyltransferase